MKCCLPVNVYCILFVLKLKISILGFSPCIAIAYLPVVEHVVTHEMESNFLSWCNNFETF